MLGIMPAMPASVMLGMPGTPATLQGRGEGEGSEEG